MAEHRLPRPSSGEREDESPARDQGRGEAEGASLQDGCVKWATGSHSE